MMKKTMKVGLAVFAAMVFTACGGSDGDSAQSIAIDKIANYAQNGGTAPTLQDYTDAGVTGIGNVDEINAFVSTLTKEQVDTTEEIQSIANQLGVVIEGNIPPIARAGAIPATVTEGETVSFSSRHSADTDGEIVSYKWTEGGVGLSNVPSFSKSDFSVGTHTITLIVTDNDGATDYDTVTITVDGAVQPTPTPTPVTLTRQDQDPNDNCKYIEKSGLDENNNGVLDDTEVTSSTSVLYSQEAPITVSELFIMIINDEDVTGVNTCEITGMAGLFSVNTTFNQDISGWNTGAVTDMRGMFYHAAAFNQDISGWNTGAVTDMAGMFSNASSFNQNIGGWDVGNVTFYSNFALSSPIEFEITKLPSFN